MFDVSEIVRRQTRSTEDGGEPVVTLAILCPILDLVFTIRN